MFIFNPQRYGQLLVLFGILLFSDLLQARVVEKEHLRVASEIDFPPYTKVDDKGRLTGFSVELLKAIAKQEGLTINWEIGQWESTLNRLEIGDVDLVPIMAITEQRKANFAFSEPYIQSFDAIFVRRGEKQVINQADLLDNPVIVVNGAIAHEYLAGDKNHQQLILVANASDGLKRLAAGDGRAMLMPRVSGQALVRDLLLEEVQVLESPVSWYKRSFGFGVSRKQIWLIPLLNSGLRHAHESGLYDELFQTWITNTDQMAISHAKTQRSLDFALTAFVLVSVLAIFFIIFLRSIISFRTTQLLQEVEQRRQIEKIADQNENLFRGAFESSMQASALLDEQGGWVRVNQALCDLLGFTKEALVNKKIRDFLAGDGYKAYLASSERLVSDGQESSPLELRCLCRNQEWRWVRLYLYRVSREDQVYDVYVQIQDISAQKDNEERLNRLLYDLKFMRTSLNRHAIISRTDANGMISYVNDKFCSVSQYSSDELIGRDHGIVNSGFHSRAFFNDMWRTISSGRVWQGDVCNRRKDGALYWVATTIVPHIGDDNKPDSYLSIRTEITKIKEVEGRLKENQAFLNRTLANIKDGIMVFNERGEISFQNPAAIDCLGDLRQVSLSNPGNKIEAMPSEIRTAINRAKHGHSSDSIPVAIASANKGEERNFLMSCYPLIKPAGEQADLMVCLHEVTKQLSVEKQLSHSNLRFDAFFENAATAIDIFDRNGHILKVNKAFESMLGYSEAEIKTLGLYAITHPDDLTISDSKLQQFINGDIDSYQIEKRYIHKDGATVWGRLTAFSVGIQEDETYMVGMIADITHEKNMVDEQARLQRRLQQAEKMEAIGALTGGIAHDFNNILASIMGYTDLAILKFCDDKEGKLNQYLTEVYKAGARARDLIAQMMDFSRAGGGSRSILSVGPVVKETLKMIEPTLPSSIRVSYDAGGDPYFVSIDPVRLNQIVMNLVINARDALGEKGEISVCLKPYNGREVECIACHTEIEGDYIELSVADNGIGIARPDLKRIFDPFYTTKDVGKGTGMGLSVVHGIVHEYDGHIIVDSKEGEGSTFSVLFKTIVADDGEEHTPGSLMEKTALLRKHVMVVDDERMITDYLDEMLASEGHRVSVYNCSEEALADFKKSPDQYDLVITDQTMPGILGSELTAQIKAISPSLPVILCTGYSAFDIEHLTAEYEDIFVMKKPIDRQQLVSLINRFEATLSLNANACKLEI